MFLNIRKKKIKKLKGAIGAIRVIRSIRSSRFETFHYGTSNIHLGGVRNLH